MATKKLATDNLKRKKLTGVKLFKLDEGKAHMIRLTAPFTPGTMKKKPAIFAHGIDNATGEMVKFLVPTVLYTTITENYVGESYVNKLFEIIKGEKVKGGNGNDYTTIEVAEIEE